MQVIKDTTEPTYDEFFDYDIDSGKLGNTELEVSVVDRKGIFARSPLMGRAVVSLANPEIITGEEGALVNRKSNCMSKSL